MLVLHTHNIAYAGMPLSVWTQINYTTRQTPQHRPHSSVHKWKEAVFLYCPMNRSDHKIYLPWWWTDKCLTSSIRHITAHHNTVITTYNPGADDSDLIERLFVYCCLKAKYPPRDTRVHFYRNQLEATVYIRAKLQEAGRGAGWRTAWRDWWESWGCWDCGSCAESVWWNPAGSPYSDPRAPPRSPGSCHRQGNAAGSCLSLWGNGGRMEQLKRTDRLNRTVDRERKTTEGVEISS